MSRPPPTPIDYAACSDAAEAARRVRDHLLGSRLSGRLGFNVEKVLSKMGWAVGSHVWRPALDVDVDHGADFDFVCVDDSRLRLVKQAIGHLFVETRNAFGSSRYMFPDGVTVAVDVWALPKGVSIAEHITSFPDLHQHVAYAVGVPVDVAMVRTTHSQSVNVRPAPLMVSTPASWPPPVGSALASPKKASRYYPGCP